MSDLVLLIFILVGGALVIGGGFYYQKNILNKKNISQNQSSLSLNEEKAKEYIEMYKSQYPRDSVKSGLLNMEISDLEAEGYLNKYF